MFFHEKKKKLKKEFLISYLQKSNFSKIDDTNNWSEQKFPSSFPFLFPPRLVRSGTIFPVRLESFFSFFAVASSVSLNGAPINYSPGRRTSCAGVPRSGVLPFARESRENLVRNGGTRRYEGRNRVVDRPPCPLVAMSLGGGPSSIQSCNYTDATSSLPLLFEVGTPAE